MPYRLDISSILGWAVDTRHSAPSCHPTLSPSSDTVSKGRESAHRRLSGLPNPGVEPFPIATTSRPHKRPLPVTPTSCIIIGMRGTDGLVIGTSRGVSNLWWFSLPDAIKPQDSSPSETAEVVLRHGRSSLGFAAMGYELILIAYLSC